MNTKEYYDAINQLKAAGYREYRLPEMVFARKALGDGRIVSAFSVDENGKLHRYDAGSIIGKS